MANTYRWTWEAPSGRTYVYRGLNPFEAMEVYGGIPELATLTEVKLDLTPEEIAAAREVCLRIVTRGTISPRIVAKEDPSDPDAVPFSELGEDMLGLQSRILGRTALAGEKADEARRFRDERGKLRPTSRDGDGERGEAERPRADSEAVSRAPARVRPHGVDQGAKVARGRVRADEARARRAG